MTNPAGASAASLGGLNWTLVSGGGVLIAANPNGTATYTAPANAATVVLKLAIAAGAQQGTNHTVTLLIVPPQGHLETVSNIFHTQGFLSIGFMARVDLTPTYVSFNRLQFQEGAVAAITTGYFVGPAPDHALGRVLPIPSCNLTNGCSPGLILPL